MFLEQLILAKLKLLLLIKFILAMDQEEIKYGDWREAFEDKRYNNPEYSESSQEPNRTGFKIINSPFTNLSIYVCSSSDFEDGVESLSDDSFNNISEQREGDEKEPENSSGLPDEDCF